MRNDRWLTETFGLRHGRLFRSAIFRPSHPRHRPGHPERAHQDKDTIDDPDRLKGRVTLQQRDVDGETDGQGYAAPLGEAARFPDCGSHHYGGDRDEDEPRPDEDYAGAETDLVHE